MAYFDGIKTGDRVWDFEFGWGTVIELLKASDVDNWNVTPEKDFDLMEVEFNDTYSGYGYYDLNGVAFYSKGNQTLFWDEIKFEVPKRPYVKLKEDNFLIQLYSNKIEKLDKPVELDYLKANGLTRDDEETAKKALMQIKRFIRLLALRDQECPDSRGFEFERSRERKWRVAFDIVDKKYYATGDAVGRTFDVYFRTEDDVERVCDILNSGKFDLEGE